MPGTFFGPYGENNSTYPNAGNANLGRFPLGHRLVLPDGRVYRFALNDGTTEIAARLYQSVAPITNHTDQAADVVRAIGSTSVSATLGATCAPIDIYAEGVVHIDAAPGEGYAYRIKRAFNAGDAHADTERDTVLTVNLEPSEKVQVALTGSSDMSFTRNRFHQVLRTLAPPTAMLAGVSPGVCGANRFYWSQVHGECAILTTGVLLVGIRMQAAIGTVGAVEKHTRRVRMGATAAADTNSGANALDSTGAETAITLFGTTPSANYDITGPVSINAPDVGICVKVNATGEESLVDLLYLGW